MKNSERVKNSEFKVLINGDISIQNATIMRFGNWSNFEGKPTKFTPAGGKRTFNLVLTEVVADALRADGWNVKTLESREEGDEPTYITQIIVNLNSDPPPVIKIYTNFHGKKRANELNENTIKILDTVSIENIDMVIHPYVHNFPNSQYTTNGYIKGLFVTQAYDESFDFGGKYDEYEEYHDSVPMGDDPNDDTIPF